jgi:peptide/nickel transport system substrate-binding protein
MSYTKRIAFSVIVMLLVIPAFVFSAGGAAGSERYPVPRKDTVVVETDTNYANFETANDFVPRGTQWGSGWHQVVTEWDWYINYATGDVILWRTTGWEYSADQKQLTWHVREGVKWNDGKPYTANDYVFTFEMLMADTGLGASTHVENVASVEAVDDYTLLIKFKNPEYRFHHKLRMWGGIVIVAKHKWEGTATREYKNWPPVETGPYMFHSYSEDLGLFVWERNRNYWGKKVHKKSPGPKYVIFRMAPPPDLDLAEFIEGAIDMTLPHIFTIEMIRSAQRKTEHVVVAPFMDVVSQGICSYNCAKFPTSLPEVRWALQYLVNREKHAKIYPMAEKSFPTMWPWPDYGSLDKWEIPAIKAKYGEQLRYDPAAAEKALDDLGYKKGSDGIRKGPKGEEFILTLVTRSSPDLGFLHAQDLSDELRKIGIKTNMRVVDAGIWGDLVNNGDYDISFDVLSTDTAFPNDPWLFFNSYHTKHVKPIGEYQTSGDRGRSRLKSPELDAIADKMAVTPPDSAQYLGLVEQGLDIWYRNLPAVPVVEKVFVQTFSDMYWTGWPDEDNMYHVPYQWWPEIMFVLFELKPAR